jgi:hypothetical protein
MIRRQCAGSQYRPFPRRARHVRPHASIKTDEPGKTCTNDCDSELRTSPAPDQHSGGAHAQECTRRRNFCKRLHHSSMGKPGMSSDLVPSAFKPVRIRHPLLRPRFLRQDTGIRASPRPFPPWTLAGRPHKRSPPIRVEMTLGSDRISTGLLQPNRGAPPQRRERPASDSPMAPLALRHPGERSNPGLAPAPQPADKNRKMRAATSGRWDHIGRRSPMPLVDSGLPGTSGLGG